MTEQQSVSDRLIYVIGLVQDQIGGLALREFYEIAEAVDEMEYRLESLEK